MTSAVSPRAVVTTVEESKVGVHVGADVAYFFTPRLGLGAMLQYAGTNMEVAATGRTFDVKVGGILAGGGLRLRF